MTEIKEHTPSNPEELVTENLVRRALETDKGEDAKFISFEIKPFTNKGDNYTSFVTSVWVKYSRNGCDCETSYVAKLNPLRPITSFSEILEGMFGVETDVFTSIIGGMNKELEKIDFPPIKSPKLFSRCLEKGKEAFLTENLREQGFKMYDRTKGMDMNHVKLVLEELGRFHAGSFLLEQTLHPKTIPESFENFKDVWNADHDCVKLFETIMVTQAENACKFLKEAGPKYESCEKWLHDHRNDLTKWFMEGYKSNKTFNILNHGDCWTNNMLFKYNVDKKPVDLRLVDLQCSRKASPAADLNYFFYSSLSGDVRQRNMDSMIFLYYDSFVKVLKSANKTPPFSYEELQEEVRSKKIFALCCAILILPAVLAQGDEIWEIDGFSEEDMEAFLKMQTEKFEKISKKEVFKDRFLAVFDEMMNYDIFKND